MDRLYLTHQRLRLPVLRNRLGYSLFEMIIVIVIIGILAAVTIRSLRGVNEVARTEETRAELDLLAHAIAGNPALTSGGGRTDFGYIGDIGALPPDLDALVANPGLATWRGPYIHDEFLAGVGSVNSTFKIDAWGRPYTFAGSTITSTGSGSPLTRQVANSIDDLLHNTVTLTVTDLALSPPGPTYRDSVLLLLTTPNGAAGISTLIRLPRPDGLAEFDSIPIGLHLLQLVYRPTADTLRRQLSINPGSHTHLDLQLPAEVW